MPRISTDNYDTVASWNGSQDLFVVEQPDGTKVATPAMVKQYVLNDMDEVPTQNSNDTVKSGGVFSAVDDVYSVMGQMGAKNLLVPEWVETQTTEKGVTYTFNVDGTITMNTDASGATDNIDCNLRSKDEITNNLFTAGSYTLTGCPSGGSSTTYRMWVRAYRPNTDTPLTSNLYDNGNGVSFTVSEPFSLVLTAAVRKNYVCNNLTFKPMLRIASDTDNTYQPYAKTNKELTEVIGDLTQTGLTGDSVAAQLTTAKGLIAGRAECFKSSSNGATQSIKIGAIAENRIFLFACGFHTNYVLELIAISSNGANVVHVPVANSGINSISDISYNANSGVISITVRNNPFGYGRMTRLS